MTAQQWYEWILSNAKDYSEGRLPYTVFSLRSRHLHDAAAKSGHISEVIRMLRDVTWTHAATANAEAVLTAAATADTRKAD